MAIGLADGVRVGVIGAGPSGCAFSGALLTAARAAGRRIDVTVFDAPFERAVRRPVILDAEARTRLTGLGSVIPPQLKTVELRGVLVHSGRRAEMLQAAPGALWVVDGAEGQASGEVILKESLGAAAALRGARFETRRVQAVESFGSGHVVRASGSSEKYDLVVGAFGAGSNLAGEFLGRGGDAPGRIFGSEVRLAFNGSTGGLSDVAIACFAPTSAVDVLYVVPCGEQAWALGIGQDVGTPDLVHALMVLSRDGLLPAGFEVVAADRVAMSAGTAKTISRDTRLWIGSAARGSLLEPGVVPALQSAVRAASAVVEAGIDPRRLKRALSRGQAELEALATTELKSLRWARRAKDGVAPTLAKVHSANVIGSRLPGLFGLPTLPAAEALPALRWEGCKRVVADLFASQSAPPPAALPTVPLVYVVDDDADARDTLVEYLSSRGIAVRGFANEVQLLEAAARERPAAILLDIVLNWVDGMSLARELKAHPATRGTHLISMSGLSRPSDRQAALDSGAEAFLPKPVNLDDLWTVLKGCLPPGRDLRPTPTVVGA